MRKVILALCFMFLAVPVGAMDTTVPSDSGELQDLSDSSLTDLTLDLKLATSFTFGEGDHLIEITLEDFKSMTLEETRNFLLLVTVCINVHWLDMELISVWGKKLLPRFFN